LRAEIDQLRSYDRIAESSRSAALSTQSRQLRFSEPVMEID
jgi:hypothetical protein